jgi:hypothetical protein
VHPPVARSRTGVGDRRIAPQLEQALAQQHQRASSLERLTDIDAATFYCTVDSESRTLAELPTMCGLRRMERDRCR